MVFIAGFIEKYNIMLKKVFITATLMVALSLMTFASDKRSKKDDKVVKIEELTKSTFTEKVGDYKAYPKSWKFVGKKPVIVDFYASWCPPCKMIAPILAELANEYDGEIIIYKVNTDDVPEVAKAFGVRSIPTLLFIPADGKIKVSTGAMPKEEFVKKIEKELLVIRK